MYTGRVLGGGGGSGVRVEDEGTSIVAAATGINFAGAGVTVTDAGANEALVTIPGGGGASAAFKFIRRTANAAEANDYSTNSTSFGAIDATNLSLSLAAATGDVLAASISGYVSAAAAQLGIDMCSIVSGAVVNYLSGAGSTGEGFQGWHCRSSVESNFSGDLFYTVQAGDRAAGAVTVRPYWRILSGSGPKILYARPIMPVQFTLQNLGPATA